MEKQVELKTAQELVLSDHLTPSEANAILNEVARYERTDVPMWRSLPSMIMTGFDWFESPKGYGYWKNVYERLLDLHRYQGYETRIVERLREKIRTQE